MIRLVLALFVATPAFAAPIPFGGSRAVITAREEPVASFLRTLFGQTGRPVAVAPGVTGAVNGQFDGPAANVFRDVARAFNLVGYWDGAIAHVYPATEIATRTYPGSPASARRTLASVAELALVDTNNRVRVTSTGMVMATGTPRFLDQVGEIARATPAFAAAPYVPPRGGASLRTAAARPSVANEALEFRVFYLRYARADDTLVTAEGRETRIPGIASILRALVLDPADQAGLAVPSARLVRTSQPRLGGRGLAAVAPDASQADASPRLAFYDRFADETVIGGDDIARAPSTPVRIQANPALNALIVRDAPERMASYEGLIRALDVEPQIVEIEATIIDIDTARLRELGIDWNLALRGFNLGINSINPLSTGGSTVSTIIGDKGEFIARINALQSKNAARVVARPQVVTLSNVEAVFDRTRTFYVRVQGQEAVDLFNVTAGTVLRVNPHVFRDRNQTRIRLQLAIEDGGILPSSVDQIPIVERASITTQALIVEGQSLLVGGLTVDREERSRERIPLLGDIPIVGNLFRNSRTSVGRTERLFLITPRIAPLGTIAATTAIPPFPTPPPLSEKPR